MLKFVFSVVLTLAPTLAFAHVGAGGELGAVHGFLHPLTGVDHILAMVAVGMFAAHLNGHRMWLVPLAFIQLMAIGGVLGVANVPMPFVEVGIGVSVVTLGSIVAAQVSPPLPIAMALVGFFALCHGYAHGAEMPKETLGLAYGAGFISATALLLFVGVGLGKTIGLASRRLASRITQLLGGAMAVAGLAILAGAL